MVMKSPLHAVKPGERAARPRAKSVSRAASGGSRLELLVAMRGRLARAVEDPNTPARDLAALTRHLLDIAKDIEQIEAKVEKDSEDVADAESTGDAEWEAI